MCKANQQTDAYLQKTIDDIKIEAAKTGIDSKDMALSYRVGFNFFSTNSTKSAYALFKIA